MAKNDKSGKSKQEVKRIGNDERAKVLEMALDNIEKQFGKGSIMKLGDHDVTGIKVIPTGVLSLDLALGIGGLPRGRIIEIYGPESSGKTTVALHCIAAAQKLNGTAAFIDAEHALDPVYAEKLGVNIDELLLAQPDNGEEALEITEALVRSGAIDVIIIDSVAALVPKAEIDGEMGDSHVGLHARLMSQALRKLTGVISKSQTVVIFINQLREKVGVIYGNPETTTGGRALKFYSSIRMDVRKTDKLMSGSEQVGLQAKIKVVKNKMAPPFRETVIDILFGEGISKEGSMIDVATKMGIIKRSGTWFSYGDVRLGQGRDNARQFLKDNPDIADEIDVKVREEVKASRVKPTADERTKTATKAVETDSNEEIDDIDELLGLDEL